MAEYPELSQLVEQMNREIAGKTIDEVEISQEKCLNVSLEEYKNRVQGKNIIAVKGLGKWIRLELEHAENIMLSLGMGGDVLYYTFDGLPADNYQLRVKLDNGNGFTCRFWWFGYIHLFTNTELEKEKKFTKIGMAPDEPSFLFEYFYESLHKKRSRIKNAILSQSIVSGIGNAYIHDILFESGLHPNALCNQIPLDSYKKLYEVMKSQMKLIKQKKGLSYEKDFYGKCGKYDASCFLIAYKEGGKCPNCNSTIEKIKTGSTSSYICPSCQKIY